MLSDSAFKVSKSSSSKSKNPEPSASTEAWVEGNRSSQLEHIKKMCSRIELKMTETEQSNCIGQSAPFVMQLALRLCFCQMPIASITNGFTETLNCSGGVTRQDPPNPPEREARASKERKKRVVGGKTPLYTIKSAATTWLPKDLRWRESRSYDVLNFLKRWGHSSGHPEGPREI